MDWTSWSQTWSTKSTTTTSRRPLRRRQKHLRWKRMYLLLRTDQRLKQKHKDLPLFAHLQELHLFVKEYGTDIEPGTQSNQAYPVAKRLNTLLRSRRRWCDWILEIKRFSSERFWELSVWVWWSVGRARCKEAEATRKDFNVVLTRQDKKLFISELFKDIQDAIPLILHTPRQCVNSGTIPSSTFITCNQFTLHHKFRIDSGRTKFRQGKTDSILYCCESHG